MITKNEKIIRNYGKNRKGADIMLNKENEMFSTLSFGGFGKLYLDLQLNKDNSYTIYKKVLQADGSFKYIPMCNTKNYKGLQKGTISLLEEYDKEKKKNTYSFNDCIYITIHNLKEKKHIKDFTQVGYITYQIGIESNIPTT